MYVLDAMDIVDMVIDYRLLPKNSRTSRLRKEIECCYNSLGIGGSTNELEKAVKDYYQYYLNCNNHAIAVELANQEDNIVNHPEHYKLPGLDFECIDFIEAKLSKERYLGYLQGNVLKYQWRAGLKGDELTDIKKANKYSEWFEEKLECADDKSL